MIKRLELKEMVLKNSRALQLIVIEDMIKILTNSFENDMFPISINAAAILIADKYGKSSDDRLVTIASRTCVRWYNLWLDYGCLPCDIKFKYRRIYRGKWTKERIATLKKIVDDNPVLFLDEIADELLRILGWRVSGSSISCCLRLILKYSRKLIYEKASQQVAEDKANFIETMRFHITKPEMAIFIDESNKDRKAARRKYGWSPIGIPVKYRSQFNRDIRFTFIGAANCFGFVIAACDEVMHLNKEKEEDQPVDADRFVEYVKTKLVPVLGRYDNQEPNSIVIMDNCSIHIDPRVSQLIEDAGAIIIYSSAYSPELIPIEYMFGQWKKYLIRFHIDFQDDWLLVHDNAIRSITPQQALNYFRNTTLVELVDKHPQTEQNKIKSIMILLAIATDEKML